MATGFTAVRARLPINWLWALLLMAWSGCTSPPQLYTADEVKGRLQVREGITLLDGKPLNGVLVDINDGDTLLYQPYHNGRKNGYGRECYPGGQPRQAGMYRNGRREGEHRQWWPNGQLHVQAHYHHDIYEGNMKRWNAAGQLVLDGNYHEGKEAGMQKQWFADGSLRANYEVINGRRYGLFGKKECATSMDKSNDPAVP